jgi:hypothetical protein
VANYTVRIDLLGNEYSREPTEDVTVTVALPGTGLAPAAVG